MLNDLDHRARQVLVNNDRGNYTVPTAGLYPYQWNWDSAFAALGFSNFDVERAWTEIETLFSGQWPDGMVPHILFHEVNEGYFPGPDIWGGIGPVPSSGITQPPVAISFARRIAIRDSSRAESRLAALYPAMLGWHRWFMRWRLDAHGAVCVTHPWEGGRDNAPDWDRAMAKIPLESAGRYQRRDTAHVAAEMRPKREDYDRYLWLVNQGRELQWNQAQLRDENPFRVADPAMTFICLRAARDLLATGTELGLEIGGLAADVNRLQEGAESLWNESINSFDSRTADDGFNDVGSSAAFLCWYAGIDQREQLKRLRAALKQVPYPIASCDPESQQFEALRYWRGPTWAFMNYLIGIGLEEFALEDEADILREATRSLISRSGFYEYYSPLTGQAAGGGSFAWTATVWLDWAGRYEEDK